MTLYKRKQPDPMPETPRTKPVPEPITDPMMYPPSPKFEQPSNTLGEPIQIARAALVSVNLETAEIAVTMFSTEDGDVTDPIYNAYALWLASKDNREMKNFIHTIIANNYAHTIHDVSRGPKKGFRGLGQ